MVKRIFFIQHEHHGTSYFMVFLLFLYGLVLWSPIITRLGNIDWEISVCSVFLCLLAFSVFQQRKLKKWFVFFFLFTFLSATIPACYWVSLKVAFFPIFLILAFFLASQSTYKEIQKFVSLSSIFLLIVLTGAVIGFSLAYLGMPPILEFPRYSYGGGTLYVYVTTITNYVRSNFIRPSGIYNEPGALSFVTCLIAFMRRACNKDYRVTWIILMLGFITFSLAHLIFVFVFLLSEKFSIKKTGFFCTLMMVAFVVIFTTDMDKVFEKRLLTRIIPQESGTIVGDNRTFRMINAWNVICDEHQALFFGVGPAYSFNRSEVKDRYKNMNDNPLENLAGRGIFLTWQYYAFVFIAIVPAFFVPTKRNLAFFGVGLLFLQRPYLYSFGYSLLGVLAIWLHFFGAYKQKVISTQDKCDAA